MKLLKQHESCTEWNKTKRNGVALRLVLHCYLKKKRCVFIIQEDFLR